MPKKPLAGRRIWFAGIGGAGLSGYAVLARAWGAEVGGWDRVDTPYLRHLDGVAVEIAPEPVAREGWEVVVSTAYAGLVEGRSRADFLAELVSLQDAIVVGGSHGKGTTTALIAFALDRLGCDPAFLVGAEVPQLDGNARAGRRRARAPSRARPPAPPPASSRARRVALRATRTSCDGRGRRS